MTASNHDSATRACRRSRRAHGDVAATRDAGGLIGGRAELKQASTECDGADREPGKAKRQARDRVAQPVHVEEHATAGNDDDEPGRDPGDGSPKGPGPAAPSAEGAFRPLEADERHITAVTIPAITVANMSKRTTVMGKKRAA